MSPMETQKTQAQRALQQSAQALNSVIAQGSQVQALAASINQLAAERLPRNE